MKVMLLVVVVVVICDANPKHRFARAAQRPPCDPGPAGGPQVMGCGPPPGIDAQVGSIKHKTFCDARTAALQTGQTSANAIMAAAKESFEKAMVAARLHPRGVTEAAQDDVAKIMDHAGEAVTLIMNIIGGVGDDVRC